MTGSTDTKKSKKGEDKMIINIKLTSHEAQIFNLTKEEFEVMLHDNNLYSTDGAMLIAVPTIYDGPRVSIHWPSNRKIGRSKANSVTLTIDTDKRLVTAESGYWGEVKVSANWNDDCKFPYRGLDGIYESLSKNDSKIKDLAAPQYGIDFSILKKITDVIGTKIILSSFGNEKDPIAVKVNIATAYQFTVPFDESKHRPSVIMPMRTR
tara:strand:- start:344 stop:967 length:624 start_codon:yes stop_codon:yes gene_type:complete